MSSANSFGQNQWLVDEMFQQFQKDPQSVDQEWRDFFAANGNPTSGDAPEPATAQGQDTKDTSDAATKAAHPGKEGTPARPGFGSR